MRNSPTRTDRPGSAENGHTGQGVAIDNRRRGTVPELFLYVPDESAYRGKRLVQAHLRNHRGYLELCWREGPTVKTVHLGKAANHSPTGKAPGAGDPRPAAGRRRRSGKAGL